MQKGVPSILCRLNGFDAKCGLTSIHRICGILYGKVAYLSMYHI